MNASTILATMANKVNGQVAYDFFNEFCNHFDLSNEQSNKALDMFQELKNMNISLELALTTATSLAKM